jgi:hypothetical protein
VNIQGSKKLKILSSITLIRLDSKLVAIMKATGGPNTTQQKNAIRKSAEINNNNLFLLERFFKNFPKSFTIIIIDSYLLFNKCN